MGTYSFAIVVNSSMSLVVINDLPLNGHSLPNRSYLSSGKLLKAHSSHRSGKPLALINLAIATVFSGLSVADGIIGVRTQTRFFNCINFL
jgi:Mn2+/Fe2+ NRAMP family transporter